MRLPMTRRGDCLAPRRYRRPSCSRPRRSCSCSRARRARRTATTRPLLEPDGRRQPVAIAAARHAVHLPGKDDRGHGGRRPSPRLDGHRPDEDDRRRAHGRGVGQGLQRGRARRGRDRLLRAGRRRQCLGVRRAPGGLRERQDRRVADLDPWHRPGAGRHLDEGGAPRRELRAIRSGSDRLWASPIAPACSRSATGRASPRAASPTSCSSTSSTPTSRASTS